MCGIAGALAFTDDFAADEAHRPPHDRHAAPPRPRRRGRASRARRAGRARPSPAVDHRPLARRATSRWPTRTGRSGSPTTARSTTTRALRAELEARGPPLPLAHRHRGDRPPLRGGGPGLRRAAATGMFAFAIWDARRRALLLARDRARRQAAVLRAAAAAGCVFGSEVKAILEHPAAPRDLDEEAFADYLTFGFTPPPRTMFRGISQARRRRADDRDGRRRGRATATWWDPMPPAAVADARRRR